MRAYLELLRTPHAARLMGGTLLGRLPNGMGVLAVTLFVRSHGGGYALAGALAATYALAAAVGQPVLGRAMDASGQPRILIPSSLLAAAGFAALALTGISPLPLAVAATAVAGFATPPLEAGLRALWPDVLSGERQVHAAYAIDAASQEILFTVGPLLVVAAAAFSEETALLVTGALGIAGTLVMALAGPSRAWRGEARTVSWAGPLHAPGLRILFAAFGCVGVALGVFNVAVVAYADARDLPIASGLLLAMMPAGALCGGFAYGARTWRGDHRRRVLVLFGCLAVGYLPLALAPGLPAMMALSWLSGVFLAPLLACSFTLIDRLAPAGTVTEAFAWVAASVGVGVALGAPVAGVAGDLSGVHGAFAMAGLGGMLAFAVIFSGRRALGLPMRMGISRASRQGSH